jgi:DNA polymerase
MMDALRKGFSYYESYARAAKNWTGEPGTLKAEFGKERYTKLKNEALGCGFGMGATKYQTYAKVGAVEAKQIVDGFRRSNPKVVNFWRKLDSLIGAAARDKEKHLDIEMPTGGALQYFNVRVKAGGHEGFVIKGDFGQQSRQGRLWGGTLTENVTQRMARDVLAEAIVNLEASGLPVAFHCHDEVILEVDADTSSAEAKSEAMRILTASPAWAPDLPLGAEGDFADAYTK